MNKLKTLLFFALGVVSFQVSAQIKIGIGTGAPAVELPAAKAIEVSYASPKEYTLAEIIVTGSKFYDAASLLSVTSLVKGDKVRIPGPSISEAIKKLMDQGILEDVQILAQKVEGENIYLEVKVKERPRLGKIQFTGIGKADQDGLNEKVKLIKGKIITETLIKNAELTIRKYFDEKGFINLKIKTTQLQDTLRRGNQATLKFDVNKGSKVKIDSIIFNGRSQIGEGALFSKMKDTKARRSSGLFSSSKFNEKKFEEDKLKIIEYYNKKGFRDARIIGDRKVVSADGKTLNLIIDIEEGKKFYFRNITWSGNYIHPDSLLGDILGLKKGDVFDMEDMNKRINGIPANDVSSLYMDDGYLYFNADPQEISIEGDSIDVQIQINEGKQATINKVILNGNTKTSDHVVMREIRTIPGQKFSKTNLIRSQRELSTLGYFNQEKIGINPVPRPDGTVDIEYTVEEKPSDQIELSGGWGGYIGFIGTLGIVFNNFSAKKMIDVKNWKGIPAGDGQKVAVRFQATGKQYQNYSLSFSEPWLGGKKPNSFSVALNRSVYRIPGQLSYSSSPYSGAYNPYGFGGYGGNSGFGYGGGGFGGGGFGGSQFGGGYGGPGTGTYDERDSTSQQFNTLSLNIGLGKRLRFPDDFFTLSTNLAYTIYDTRNFGIYPNGKTNGVTLAASISRNSVSDPTYPRSGSSFTLLGTFTPPYSLLGTKNTVNFLEYHKWMFDASWYTSIVGKLVLSTRAHFGLVGRYNKQKDFTLFERFDLGGSGMNNQGNFFNARDIVSLRGYEDRVVGPYSQGGQSLGGVIYNKYIAELRYPVSLNPSATIFVLAFAEGGNNFGTVKEYSPFNLRKSAGIGARIFMPAFGMIGIDYGKGFDPIDGVPGVSNRGLKAFTFSIGQQIR
jgi:outer membrane protein insertion porin family